MSSFSTCGSVSKLGNQAVVEPKTGGPGQTTKDNKNRLTVEVQKGMSRSLRCSPPPSTATGAGDRVEDDDKSREDGPSVVMAHPSASGNKRGAD